MVILTSGSNQVHIKMHIGIDLGGTKTESIIIDENGKELERIRRTCLLYTSPSPRDREKSRMPSSA